MGMNATLAAMYDTNGAGEEQTKIAHLELFAKAAAAQGIDLTELDSGTANGLFEEFTSKLAMEEGEEEDDEDDEDDEDEEDKEASARQEFNSMNEWTEKNAQADFLGRRMAHSFWDEYNEISKEAAGVPTVKGVKAGLQAAGSGAKNWGKRVMGDKSQARKAFRGLPAMEKQKYEAEMLSHVGAGGKKLRNQIEGAGAAIAAKRKDVQSLAPKRARRQAAAGGAALALGAGGGYAASKRGGDKEVTAGAFDLESAEHAVKIASAAGWDTNEVVERLTAVITLGPGETEKVAYAGGNYDDALAIRGLELLEQADYPVDWTQVFGE